LSARQNAKASNINPFGSVWDPRRQKLNCRPFRKNTDVRIKGSEEPRQSLPEWILRPKDLVLFK
jgi:hypothetical protein